MTMSAPVPAPSCRRPARLRVHAALLVMRAVEAWSSEVENISASGLLMLRPRGWTGKLGDEFVLDVVLGDGPSLYLTARVTRQDDFHVGFAYLAIPPEKEEALWSLLGAYADKWDDPSAVAQPACSR